MEVGDHIEFVDDSLTYAIGFSGGLEKLQTPNANVDYLIVNAIGTPHNGTTGGSPTWLDLTIPNDPGYGIEPSPKGVDLTLESPQPDWAGDVWTTCSSQPIPWNCASGGITT